MSNNRAVSHRLQQSHEEEGLDSVSLRTWRSSRLLLISELLLSGSQVRTRWSHLMVTNISSSKKAELKIKHHTDALSPGAFLQGLYLDKTDVFHLKLLHLNRTLIIWIYQKKKGGLCFNSGGFNSGGLILVWDVYCGNKENIYAYPLSALLIWTYNKCFHIFIDLILFLDLKIDPQGSILQSSSTSKCLTQRKLWRRRWSMYIY